MSDDLVHQPGPEFSSARGKSFTPPGPHVPPAPHKTAENIPEGLHFVILRDVWGDSVFVPVHDATTHYNSAGVDTDLTVPVDGVGSTVAGPHIGVPYWYEYPLKATIRVEQRDRATRDITIAPLR